MDVRRVARWYWGKLIGSGRPRHFTVSGRQVTVHHSGSIANRNAMTQCFIDRQYEVPTTGVNYRQKIRSHYDIIVAQGGTPLIIDAGANIGASALWFHATYPAAAIVAIEPAEDNLSLLRVNCIDAAFDIRAAALGPQDGETRLTDPGSGADGYRTSDEAGQGYTVPMVSVGSILRDRPAPEFVPFILKIDIEGGETRLFDGDTAAIAQFPVIAIEPHDWMLPGEGTALGFFRFHFQNRRDFSYHMENIFSIAYASLCA